MLLKRAIVSCTFVLVVSGVAGAQQLQDVVYLKNGGIIRGIIIEQVPGQSIKIQTRDGSVFVYSMDEVQKMTREAPVGESTTSTGEQVPMGSLWYVNPLGFLQMGPIVGAEWRLSDTISLDTHWRYAALGALYHLVATGLTGNELNPLSMRSAPDR